MALINKIAAFSILFLLFSFCRLAAEEDLEKIKEGYFSRHEYSAFVDYLSAVKGQEPAWISYYIALSRYEQLRYLQESQNWQEYFDKSEQFRRQFLQQAQKARELASPKSALFIYSRYLLWRFYRDIFDDERQAGALEDLLYALEQYLELPEADLSAVKFVAAKLSEQGERSSARRVYRIYLERLSAGLLEDKELALASLISEARELVLSEDPYSAPFFAEEIFQKIEEADPAFILDQPTLLLRARNLERVKEYQGAGRQYKVLVENYPASVYYAEAIFKLGVIYAYTRSDISAGLDYFAKLIAMDSDEPHVFSARYQSGLLLQYQDNLSKAEEHYRALLDRAQEFSCCVGLVNQATARLKEIEEGRPLDFNLRVFMDILKDGWRVQPAVEVKTPQLRQAAGEEFDISSFVLSPESGCFPVNLEYFWSGDTGSATPSSSQNRFKTGYACRGTKLVQLTVITPSGVLGRDFIFLNIVED